MKPLRLFLVILALFASNNLIQAQSSSIKGRQVIDKLSEKLETLDAFMLEFSILLTKGKVNDELMGKIYIKSNHKYRLEMDDMNEYFDGKTKWTYLKDIEEVEITNDTKNMFDPFEVIAGQKEDYKYSYIETKGNIQVVEMYPKIPANKKFFKIRFSINKTHNFLKECLIYEKGGQVITYKVHNYDLKKDYPNSFFEFHKSDHPDVEIVDLR